MQRRLTSAVSSAKKKQEKRLSQILEKRRQCEGVEEDRIKGELLTANLYRLKQGMRSCELENYYDEKGGAVKIVLDERLSPPTTRRRILSATANKSARSKRSPRRRRK